MSTESLRKASNPWLVLAIVCLAQFMVVLDSTVVNVALPTLQTELDFSSSSLPWVINAYTLMFGGFLLLGGRAADLFGRRRLFLYGIIAFTAASLLDGLAPSANTLILARGLQGLGAALVSPAALSIVTTTFEDGRPRTRAMGVWAAIAVGGAALGLLLGGILTEYATWRWIFFVNIPIGLVTYLLARRFVPESRVTEHSGFDIAGAVTVTAGLILLVTGIVKVQDYGWASVETFGFLAASALLLGSFVVIELRAAHPLMRLDIFRTRSLSIANATMLVVIGGMFAVFYFATLYVQQILHLSPVQAGLGFLPLTAAIILASGLAQPLIGRVGIRNVALAGMSIGAVGLLLLARARPDGSYLADVLPGILVIGIGLGFTFVPLTLIGTTNVDARDAGLASGLFNTSQQIGGALGLAILSTFAANRTTNELASLGRAPNAAESASALVSGYHVGFVAGAGLLLIGVAVTASFLRRSDVATLDQGQETDAPATAHRPLEPAFEIDD